MLYSQSGHDAKTPFHLPLGFRREVGRKQSLLNVIATLIIISIAMTSCGKKPSEISPDDRKAIESIVATTHGADSLALLQQQMENDDNLLGSVIAYRELGKILRNESRFEEALRAHRGCVRPKRLTTRWKSCRRSTTSAPTIAEWACSIWLKTTTTALG